MAQHTRIQIAAITLYVYFANELFGTWRPYAFAQRNGLSRVPTTQTGMSQTITPLNVQMIFSVYSLEM
jgi:hypothetical protein